MFNKIKMTMYEIVRDYHHHMVTYYDDKAARERLYGYSGLRYNDLAWKHLSKELELTKKLMKANGV